MESFLASLTTTKSFGKRILDQGSLATGHVLRYKLPGTQQREESCSAAAIVRCDEQDYFPGGEPLSRQSYLR